MQPPHAELLLEVWERGLDAPPARRALALVAAACPDRDARGLTELPLGARDRLLLALRGALFGSLLRSVAQCPRCNARVEMEFSVESVSTGDDAPGGEAFESGAYHVRFRPWSAGDLADAAALPAPEARRLLVERCVVDATREGAAVAPAELPAEVTEMLAAVVAASDPQAHVDLSLECPSCGHGWLAAFDIASFLWKEIDAWARRTLSEVHTLALAYGWSEPEILALSPFRRQLYLEMVTA